jgi:hypothetical protein
MPGEFHRSSVHCVKERLDLEVVPISLCSALTFLGSRRLSNVCWNQPVRATLSPLRPATNRAGQSPGKVKKAHEPVSRMATRSSVMCEFRLKTELGMERCRDNAPPIGSRVQRRFRKSQGTRDEKAPRRELGRCAARQVCHGDQAEIGWYRGRLGGSLL